MVTHNTAFNWRLRLVWILGETFIITWREESVLDGIGWPSGVGGDGSSEDAGAGDDHYWLRDAGGESNGGGVAGCGEVCGCSG